MLHTVMEAAVHRTTTAADHHRLSAAGAATLAGATPAGERGLRVPKAGAAVAEAVVGVEVEEAFEEEAADGARSPVDRSHEA